MKRRSILALGALVALANGSEAQDGRGGRFGAAQLSVTPASSVETFIAWLAGWLGLVGVATHRHLPAARGAP